MPGGSVIDAIADSEKSEKQKQFIKLLWWWSIDYYAFQFTLGGSTIVTGKIQFE